MQDNQIKSRELQNDLQKNNQIQNNQKQSNQKQNNQKQNYQKQLEQIIQELQNSNVRPSLFLHSCCAPCSSYCMEYLREYFDITVFYYNPNISEDTEYRKRVDEEKRLIEAYNKQVEAQNFEHMNSTNRATEIKIIDGDYEPECFYEIARGLEQCPEGGERCFKCYELRLRKSFEVASVYNNQACKETDKLQSKNANVEEIEVGCTSTEGLMTRHTKYDFITTTLTISPLKNAEKLNEIGQRLAEEYQIKWLPSDFKKKNGYKRSIELSAMFDLYRQDFCGCAFSKAERNRSKAESDPL